MRKKIFHFYRSDVNKSSRIKAQLKIDKGEVRDNLHLLDFSVLYVLFFKSSCNDVFIFHQQRCLLNLLICTFFNFFMKKIKIVYDIHDLLEYDKRSRMKVKIYFLLFSFFEKLAFSSDIRFLTVSDGLSRVLYLKYKKKIEVFYNLPPDDFCKIKKFSRTNEKNGKCIYFGQINEVRLPLELLGFFKNEGLCIDVYGVFASTLEYKEAFSFFEKSGVVKYFGVYEPDTILSILSYYSFSLLYFPSERVNLRFCLPNKLFQSFFANVRCIISSNLSEIRIKFGSTNGVLSISELNSKNQNKKNIDSRIIEMISKSTDSYARVIS